VLRPTLLGFYALLASPEVLYRQSGLCQFHAFV
jgi:hypothetical protein